MWVPYFRHYTFSEFKTTVHRSARSDVDDAPPGREGDGSAQQKKETLEKKTFICYVESVMALGTSHQDSTSRTQNRWCRSRRAIWRTSLAALALSAGLFAGAVPVAAEEDSNKLDYLEQWEESDAGLSWRFSPAVYAGYTDLLHGYDEYQNSPNGGAEIYMRPPIPQFPTWRHRLVGRISADYFALNVPEAVKGVTQDLVSLNASVLFRWMNFDGKPEHERWIPFVGGGAGVYQDRIKMEHPIYGDVKSHETYMGFLGCGGIMLPAIGPLRFIPEVRYHAINRYGAHWVSHVTYQLGLAYWLPARVEE